MNGTSVSFPDGSPMDGEPVWTVFGDDAQNSGKFLWIFPSKPAFDGEGTFRQSISQASEDGIHRA